MAKRKWSGKKLYGSFLSRIKKQKLFKHKKLKQFFGVSAFAVVILLALAFSPFFTSTKQSTSSVPYKIQITQDPNLELNDTKQVQAGANGTNTTTYKVSKSLFNIIFGGERNKIEISSTVNKAPVPQITANGTKKYQYMYCSDGGYRYYTDDQFKNPNTGFTHKSPDYCAQNKEGSETQLAGAPPHTAAAKTTPIVSNFSIPNCTTTSIPYGIDHESVSWLPSGQTQTYPGLNGTYFSCLGTTVQPLNEVVYTGTGINYNAVAQEQARSAAREKCTADYNYAKAQLSIHGAGNSSAMDYVQQLYSQCLNAAG